MSVSPATPNQKKLFKEIVDAAIRSFFTKRAPDRDAFQRLFARTGELRCGIITLLETLVEDFPKHTEAHEILGGDFITPVQVMATSPGIKYSPEQIATLSDSIPDPKVLEWCKLHAYAVIPGPPRPMSLIAIHALRSENFFSKTDAWFANPKERFSRDDKVACGWLIIRKTMLRRSVDLEWSKQLALLSKEERVPNVAEVAWFLSTFFQVHGVRLFGSFCVRTSSTTSCGNRVVVGAYQSEGMSIGDHDRGDQECEVPSVALATARNIPT